VKPASHRFDGYRPSLKIDRDLQPSGRSRPARKPNERPIRQPSLAASGGLAPTSAGMRSSTTRLPSCSAQTQCCKEDPLPSYTCRFANPARHPGDLLNAQLARPAQRFVAPARRAAACPFHIHPAQKAGTLVIMTTSRQVALPPLQCFRVAADQGTNVEAPGRCSRIGVAPFRTHSALIVRSRIRRSAATSSRLPKR
jgi:hypothetical protein